MDGYGMVAARLGRAEIVILDGATGTELQRRGVAMDDAAWCALATLGRPDILREIHVDYLRAGAHVITTNTFPAARQMLAGSGRGDDAPVIYREAVRIARDAVQLVGRPAAVAGSISTMRPVLKGQDRRDPGFTATGTQVRGWMDEAACTLAEAGADLLLLEMIGDLGWGVPAIEAALATGLPVWVGIAVRRGPGGRLSSYHDDAPPLEEFVAELAALPIAGLGVMHSALPEIAPTVALIRRHWAGPVMAYPEAGQFRAPDWVFEELTPAELVEAAHEWRRLGADVLGGCCGLGPAHIGALSGAFATATI